jgi:hypothetical protein
MILHFTLAHLGSPRYISYGTDLLGPFLKTVPNGSMEKVTTICTQQSKLNDPLQCIFLKNKNKPEEQDRNTNFPLSHFARMSEKQIFTYSTVNVRAANDNELMNSTKEVTLCKELVTEQN